MRIYIQSLLKPERFLLKNRIFLSNLNFEAILKTNTGGIQILHHILLWFLSATKCLIFNIIRFVLFHIVTTVLFSWCQFIINFSFKVFHRMCDVKPIGQIFRFLTYYDAIFDGIYDTISYVIHGAMTQWLKCQISNPGVPCSRPLSGSKVDSAFHPFEVDKMSTRNFWELSGKN